MGEWLQALDDALGGVPNDAGTMSRKRPCDTSSDMARDTARDPARVRCDLPEREQPMHERPQRKRHLGCKQVWREQPGHAQPGKGPVPRPADPVLEALRRSLVGAAATEVAASGDQGSSARAGK